MMWYVLAGCLALAALGAHAQTDVQISPVTSLHPVVLTVQVTLDGVPFEASPLNYPPDAAGPITGTGVLETGGRGDIVLVEVNGTIADTLSSVGNPLAVMLYGEVAPDGNWTADVPVVHISDGESLKSVLDGGGTITLTYGKNYYSLNGINDITTVAVGSHTFGVAVGDDAIQIIDVTDPERLTAVGSLPYEGLDVEPIPDTAYVLIAYPDGVYVLDMSRPYQPDIAYVMTDDENGYERLGGASDIMTFTTSGRTFAVITAFEDDGVQIVDVTDPANPAPVSSVADELDGYEALDGARGLDVTQISGRMYGVVASYNEDAIQIIDLVNPYLPLPVSIFYNNTNSAVRLDGPTDVEVIIDDGEAYALVTASKDDALQIINVTTPAVPAAIRSIADNEGRFGALAGATDIDVVTVGSTTYGLISGYDDDAIQVIDLNNPSLPRAVSSTLDDEDYDFYLDGVGGMEAVTILGTQYVLAAAHLGDGIQVVNLDRPASPEPAGDVSSPKDVEISFEGSWGMDTFVRDDRTYLVVAVYDDDAIQVVDVTNPLMPLPVSNVFDETGEFEALGGATDVETISVDGRVYGVVAAYDDDAIQIIDLTDPADPRFVQEVFDGENGFEALDGPIDVETTVIAGRAYAAVASYAEDAVQLIDLTDPVFPLPTTDIRHREVFIADEDIGEEDPVRIRVMEGPRAVAFTNILDKTYCLVAGQNDDTILILDVTNPARPWPVSVIHDDLRGLRALNGAADIEVIKVGGMVYAMVTGKWDGGVQMLDITDPADPEVVAAVFDNREGYGALNGASDIEAASISNRILAVVSASFDDALQVIDVTNPAIPEPLHAVYDGSGGYVALNGADDVEVVRISGDTYVMVSSAEEEAIQIMMLSQVDGP